MSMPAGYLQRLAESHGLDAELLAQQWTAYKLAHGIEDSNTELGIKMMQARFRLFVVQMVEEKGRSHA